MSKENVICSECGKEFVYYTRDDRNTKNHFCSIECRYSWEYKNCYIELKCEQCGKLYTVRKGDSKNGTRRFCSDDCKITNLREINEDKHVLVKCEECEKEINKFKNYSNYSKKLFCSQKCYQNNRKKESYNNKYRTLAFNSYPSECEFCKIKLTEECLDVHHIDENRRNNDLSNLIILCPTHHRMINVGWAEIDKNRNYIILSKRKKVSNEKRYEYRELNENNLINFLKMIEDLKNYDTERNLFGFKSKMAKYWNMNPTRAGKFIKKIENMLFMGMTYDDIKNEKEKYFNIVFQKRKII